MNDENPQAPVEAAWSKVTQEVERIEWDSGLLWETVEALPRMPLSTRNTAGERIEILASATPIRKGGAVRGCAVVVRRPAATGCELHEMCPSPLINPGERD